MPKLKDIFNSSRRLIFENDCEKFSYSSRGTCFLCRYRDLDFAITAKHVTKGYCPEDVRIPFHQSARKFVPHNAGLTINKKNVGDQNWADLEIFPLERSQYQDDQFAGELPYLIPNSSHIWQPNMSGHFIMRGFHHEKNFIDYDKLILRQQAIQLEADYVEPSPMDHCHEIEFRDISMCKDLDGLSGTPVFWLGKDKPCKHCFAGILIMATYSSKRGHFIHAKVILTFLDKATGLG